MNQFLFDEPADFLAKLRELLATGVPAERITIATPIPVHEAMVLLKTPVSPLKYFTFTGAFTGAATGFALTIYTVHSWPIITGGKPLISMPPFMIIVFELTILLGAIASMLGFLHLSRLPTPSAVINPQDTGGKYTIWVEETK